MKGKLIKTPEQFYKLKFYNDEDMLACATALLSKQNCDEIFGVFDVQKLAKEVLPNDDTTGTLSKQKGFVIGFNKAMELNKDKVFTLEDMRTAMTYGIVQEGTGFEGIHSVDDLFNLILKKVSQPTEIEVMVEMEWLPIATFCTACGSGGEHMKTPCDHKNDCSHWSPKLDSNGCLILKRAE